MSGGRLEGRVALVTGGSRGFGRATAELFAREGARVAIWYRDRVEEAAAVRAKLERSGAQAVAQRVDVRQYTDVEAATASLVDSAKRIDIVVNCAGTLTRGLVTETDPSAWATMVETNIWGTINTVTAVSKIMVDRGYGRIITLASPAAQAGWENGAVYAGTKGFVLAFTKSIAIELGRYGITANCIGPAGIITDMNRDQYTPDWQEKRAASVPVRHLGSVDDVAYAALGFADQDAGYLTGQILYPTGGGTMGL